MAAADAWPRLPRAPAPGAPWRHLNLPAPSARDPHRTPPSLSPHPGRRGPPHPAARHTGPAAPTGPFCPHNAGDSRSHHAWPSHTRGRPTDPAASTDSHLENTLVKGGACPRRPWPVAPRPLRAGVPRAVAPGRPYRGMRLSTRPCTPRDWRRSVPVRHSSPLSIPQPTTIVKENLT